MNRIISVFAIALTTLGLGACSAPSIDEQPAEEFATEGLHPVSGTGFESAYVLPAANLPQYTAIEFPPFSSADVEVTQTTVTGTSRSAWIMTHEKRPDWPKPGAMLPVTPSAIIPVMGRRRCCAWNHNCCG